MQMYRVVPQAKGHWTFWGCYWISKPNYYSKPLESMILRKILNEKVKPYFQTLKQSQLNKQRDIW